MAFFQQYTYAAVELWQCSCPHSHSVLNYTIRLFQVEVSRTWVMNIIIHWSVISTGHWLQDNIMYECILILWLETISIDCSVTAVLTGVWTIFIRWCLMLVITLDTSTIPSFSTCFRIMSMAINVPVRPTPALYDNRVLITSSCSTVHLPAVNHNGSLWWLVFLSDATMEGQDGSTILRDTMIRPGGEVVMCYHTWVLRATW